MKYSRSVPTGTVSPPTRSGWCLSYRSTDGSRNGTDVLNPVAQMIVSNSVLVPSANNTVFPVMLSMPGRGVMRPWWIQYSSRLLTTGFCRFRLRVAGTGRPR
jgi:hypothetical protein